MESSSVEALAFELKPIYETPGRPEVLSNRSVCHRGEPAGAELVHGAADGVGVEGHRAGEGGDAGRVAGQDARDRGRGDAEAVAPVVHDGVEGGVVEQR